MKIIKKEIVVKRIVGIKNFLKAFFLGEFDTDKNIKIRVSNIPILFACFESAKHQLPFTIKAYQDGPRFQVVKAW